MAGNPKKTAALVLHQVVFVALALSLVASIPVFGQQAQPAQGDNAQPPAGAPNPAAQNAPQPAQQLPPDTVRPNYVLGPNDQILIRAPEAEEIDNRPFRIDGDGNINLPLVGRIHAAGMSLQELEAGPGQTLARIYSRAAGLHHGGPIPQRAGLLRWAIQQTRCLSSPGEPHTD